MLETQDKDFLQSMDQMEDISPKLFISELNPAAEIDFNPVFEIKFMNDEPSVI